MKRAPAYLVYLALAASGAAYAQSESYTIDKEHSFPTYEVEHLGLSTQIGRFNDMRGQIVLDVSAKTGSVEVTINAASIDTGLPKLENALRGENWLNVEKFPNITFRGSKARFDGERLVGFDGDLTIAGVTKPASLTVDDFHCRVHPLYQRKACAAMVRTAIKRGEFGMTKLAPSILADEVKIRIPLEAIRDQ